jgi:electron transfer flavoprotein alpha subunit
VTDARVLVVADADDTLARLVSAARCVGSVVEVLKVSVGPVAQHLVQHARGCRAVLAAADDFGRDVLPRAAALAGCAVVTDVVAFPSPETAVRPMFADSVLATVALPMPVFITVRTASFAPADSIPTGQRIEAPADPRVRTRPGATAVTGPNLATAPIVMGAGRGAATPARMEGVRRLAKRLGAAVGATRPPVDEGLAPLDALLGQSGKMVAPRLYIALGISGALQHLAGVKDAAVIAAINTDAEAPMCEAADLVWIADLDTALPELEAALAELP